METSQITCPDVDAVCHAVHATGALGGQTFAHLIDSSPQVHPSNTSFVAWFSDPTAYANGLNSPVVLSEPEGERWSSFFCMYRYDDTITFATNRGSQEPPEPPVAPFTLLPSVGYKETNLAYYTKGTVLEEFAGFGMILPPDGYLYYRGMRLDLRSAEASIENMDDGPTLVIRNPEKSIEHRLDNMSEHDLNFIEHETLKNLVIYIRAIQN